MFSCTRSSWTSTIIKMLLKGQCVLLSTFKVYFADNTLLNIIIAGLLLVMEWTIVLYCYFHILLMKDLSN